MPVEYIGLYNQCIAGDDHLRPQSHKFITRPQHDGTIGAKARRHFDCDSPVVSSDECQSQGGIGIIS